MIRWKAVLPTFVILGAIGLLVRLCAGPLLERAIEKYGTQANGAKVELSGVDLSFLHTSLTLKGLQVTDAAEPMKNALEVGQMRFHLATKPLFWKKIVIQDASITGIRTGTDRKASGALPKEKERKKKEEDKAEKKDGPKKKKEGKEKAVQESEPLPAMGNLREQFDPQTMIQPENLTSYQKTREEQVHYQAIAGTWETRVDALKTSDLEPRVKAFTDRVKATTYSGKEGLVKAKKDLDEAKKLKQDADALKKGFESLKTDLKAEIARAKATVASIDDLKKQDLDGALGGLKSVASPEGLAKRVIGDQWFGKVRHYLDLVETVRAKMPKKKAGEEKPAPPPAREGKDIPFPFHHNWPTFHLVKAELSGATAGGDPMDYKGTLKDVTSDPKKLGRPAVLAVAGKKAPRALDLDLSLDYTKETPRERLKFSYAGMPLAGMKLGDAGGPVTIKDGRGKAGADVSLTGPALSGAIRFDAAPVALDHTLPADKAGDRLLSVIHNMLSGLDALDATLRLSDTLASPNFKLETSLDEKLKTAVSAAIQKEVDAIRAEAKKRVDDLVDGEKAKLAQDIDGRAAGAMGKLGLKDKQVQSVQGQVQKLSDDLAKKSTQSILPAGGDLKKLFKK